MGRAASLTAIHDVRVLQPVLIRGVTVVAGESGQHVAVAVQFETRVIRLRKSRYSRETA